MLRWRPPRIALALSAAALAGHAALWGEASPMGSAPLAGALLAAAGFAWMLWAWALFRAAGTPIRPTDTPLQLIEEGPYRLGRHPMYLGLTVLMLGAALGLGAPLLGMAALVFAALVHTVHVPHEEAQMAQRFGGWWRDYAAVTRRWL
ncbi:MAG: isoprenylcysteine carboxylmethyltransferase family protein [Rhizobacter sp.]|nr:isoprenylcysteine carboxylmethyltransferase family protein [Rhizobacter sp.]